MPQSYWIGGSLPVQVRDLNGDTRPEIVTVDDESDSLRVLVHR